MVAKPDLKSGFQTDSKTGFDKKLGSGLKSGFQIQIRFKSGFQITNPD
jgi:hypothetical protein